MRDVVVLEQDLVADRAPQVRLARLAGFDLGAERGAARGVVSPVDLGQERGLLVGGRLRLEVPGALVRAGDLAGRIGVDAPGRVRGAAHVVDERGLEQDLDGAVGERVGVLDVLPARRDRRGAKHLKVGGGLERLPGH
ncbi:MAG TPA: hypothetical protein VGD37_22400, partial [Kofleriaceae bacterium]